MLRETTPGRRYSNGLPMSREDQVIYKWLTRAAWAGLILITMTIELLVVLAVVGK